MQHFCYRQKCKENFITCQNIYSQEGSKILTFYVKYVADQDINFMGNSNVLTKRLYNITYTYSSLNAFTGIIFLYKIYFCSCCHLRSRSGSGS